MQRALIVGILSCAFGAPSAQADPPPEIRNPVWLRQPDARDFARNYPAQAASQAVEGRATIECFVRLDTTLDCRVTAESPVSWGFGDATLLVAQSFRVEPARVDGVPTEGGRIRRTIRWVMPPEERDFTGMSAEERAMIEAVLPPILPSWEEAPTTESVLRETPSGASGVEGRGVLSCRVREDRRLSCEPLAEMPAGRGFSAAAMRLASQFRIAQSSEGFAAEHRTEPFVLPISFGSLSTITPVNRNYLGVGPINLPPTPAPSEMIPAALSAAHLNGIVTVVCTVQPPPARPSCAIETEAPTGYSLGETVLRQLGEIPPPPPGLGMIAGDQVRFTVYFGTP
jgi:TonB family protein